MYDVIVVGGGHAGCEAVCAAAGLGCRVLLITGQADQIGSMPCNPSVGGLAKSQLVVELDALGGRMAENADATGLHFRVLNATRGPAVRANRVQCDKQAYAERMQTVLRQNGGCHILEDEVCGIEHEHRRVHGVQAVRNGLISAKKVILTTGTALGGRIHVGRRSFAGAGGGRPAAEHLSRALINMGFDLRRLKTGTPPRLNASTVHWERLVPQPSEQPTPFLSWRTLRGMFHVEHCEALRPWIPGENPLCCYLTQTGPDTHAIIRQHLSLSARYGGYIQATGVRYCPSIEDKIVKFPDRDHHVIYLEPEGRYSSSLYVNGLSNSFPEAIQEKIVHSIPGLEHAAILQYGYAIGYDCLDPRCLRSSLQSREYAGLYCAGQINGTTGYEEAAAQGFVAGVNAAAAVKEREPLCLERHEAYIGVMLDDLVTKGTDEPYRMFTSRAERRLWLRQDNARFRLLDHAKKLALVDPAALAECERFVLQIEKELTRLHMSRDGSGTSWFQVLCRPGVRYADLPGSRRDLDPVVTEQVEIQARYSGYLHQEERAVERARLDSQIPLPPHVAYGKILALRVEAREKLQVVQPENLGRAGRIPGVNPADVAILSVLVRRGQLPLG